MDHVKIYQFIQSVKDYEKKNQIAVALDLSESTYNGIF